MSISPTALRIGGGIAAAATAGAITFADGQKHDATATSGSDASWNRKVVGTSLTTGSAAVTAVALGIATKGTGAANVGAAVGVGVLFGGIAGSIGGFLGSMAID